MPRAGTTWWEQRLGRASRRRPPRRRPPRRDPWTTRHRPLRPGIWGGTAGGREQEPAPALDCGQGCVPEPRPHLGEHVGWAGASCRSLSLPTWPFWVSISFILWSDTSAVCEGRSQKRFGNVLASLTSLKSLQATASTIWILLMKTNSVIVHHRSWCCSHIQRCRVCISLRTASLSGVLFGRVGLEMPMKNFSFT